jgi:hypothetical protein
VSRRLTSPADAAAQWRAGVVRGPRHRRRDNGRDEGAGYPELVSFAEDVAKPATTSTKPTNNIQCLDIAFDGPYIGGAPFRT